MVLEEKILEYFKGRLELVESSHFNVLFPIINASLECFQNKCLYENFNPPRTFRIDFENMVGFPEQRKKYVEDLERYAKEFASKLYRFSREEIDIDKCYLMVHGSSMPIRVDLTLKSGNSKINKTMYIKCFDPIRAFGIELYSLISGIGEEYRFFLNKGIIVEDSLEGAHEFDFEKKQIKKIKDSQTYIIERIKLDLISFYMGLDDITKKDNYLITQEGMIRVIDFDTNNQYSEKDIEKIKKETCKNLGITIQKYEKIYKEQERLLRDRILREYEKINKLLNIISSIDDVLLAEIGAYIKSRIDHLIKK